MVDEIINLGFNRLELGYDLRLELVSGVKSKIASGEITCPSVHNYCPVPIGAMHGHPELFSLSSLDEHERKNAIRYTSNTIDFAADIGAKAVVVHVGNVKMRHFTRKLINLIESGKRHSPKFEKLKLKMLMIRDKKAPKHIDQLYRSLEALLPKLEETSIAIGIENLPSWEAIPTEVEASAIFKKFDSPFIRYWHDMGHAQIRHNLCLTSHKLWFGKLSPYLIGMHIHDVKPPAGDHIMPPNGNIKFSDFNSAPKHAKLLVLEPCPGIPPEHVTVGYDIIKSAWSG